MTPSAPDWGALQDAIAGDGVLPGPIHPPSGKDAFSVVHRYRMSAWNVTIWMFTMALNPNESKA
jgi:hypothetical protein